MPEKCILPKIVVLDRHTWQPIKTETQEISQEQMDEYLRPWAKMLAEGFVKELMRTTA